MVFDNKIGFFFFPAETNWLFFYPTIFLETRNYTKHVTMFQNVDVNI